VEQARCADVRRRDRSGWSEDPRVHRIQSIRVWYNTEYYKLDGTPVGNTEGRTNQSARATRLEVNNYRALSSVMAIVDARRMKGVSSVRWRPMWP